MLVDCRQGAWVWPPAKRKFSNPSSRDKRKVLSLIPLVWSSCDGYFVFVGLYGKSSQQSSPVWTLVQCVVKYNQLAQIPSFKQIIYYNEAQAGSIPQAISRVPHTSAQQGGNL